jgi:hypothetical protein
MARSTMARFAALALVAALFCGAAEARSLDFQTVALGAKAVVPVGGIAESPACTQCKKLVAEGEAFVEDPANIAKLNAEVKTLCAKTGAAIEPTVRDAAAFRPELSPAAQADGLWLGNPPILWSLSA